MTRRVAVAFLVAKPAVTTTAKPTTTTTTIPASMARVSIVNDYPAAVVVKVNGVTRTVAAGGRSGPFGVKPGATDGNDVASVARADDPTCGTGGAAVLLASC